MRIAVGVRIARKVERLELTWNVAPDPPAYWCLRSGDRRAGRGAGPSGLAPELAERVACELAVVLRFRKARSNWRKRTSVLRERAPFVRRQDDW